MRYMEPSCLARLRSHDLKSRTKCKLGLPVKRRRCPAVTVLSNATKGIIAYLSFITRALPTFHFTVSTPRHPTFLLHSLLLCTCQSFFFACTCDHHFAYYPTSFAYPQQTPNQFIHHPLLLIHDTKRPLPPTAYYVVAPTWTFEPWQRLP